MSPALSLWGSNRRNGKKKRKKKETERKNTKDSMNRGVAQRQPRKNVLERSAFPKNLTALRTEGKCWYTMQSQSAPLGISARRRIVRFTVLFEFRLGSRRSDFLSCK